jgi:hypothetical protein
VYTTQDTLGELLCRTLCTDDDVLGCTLGELHDVQHDDGNSALGVYGG